MSALNSTAHQSPVIRRVTPNVVVISPQLRASGLTRDTLHADADRIERYQCDAVIHGPQSAGLVTPTSALIVRADIMAQLVRLSPTLPGAVHDEDPTVDPFTALLDLQWWLQLMGQRIQVLPAEAPQQWPVTQADAVARRFSGILAMITNNLSDPYRGPLSTLVQLHALSSALHDHGTDTTTLDLQRSPGDDDVPSVTVATAALGGAFGIDRALNALAQRPEERSIRQSSRLVNDRVLLPQIQATLPLLLTPGVSTSHNPTLSTALGIDNLLNDTIHVLLAPSDRSHTPNMDGLPRVTTRTIDLTTDVTTHNGHPVEGWVDHQVAWADVLVFSGTTMADVPGALTSKAAVVADFSHIDVQEWLMVGPRNWDRSKALRTLLRRADLVIAMDDVQRSILLGALAGVMRVNPSVYDADPSLQTLVTADPSGQALREFCLRPRRSMDSRENPLFAETPEVAPKPSDMTVAVQYFREGGILKVASKAAGRMRRIASAPVKGNH